MRSLVRPADLNAIISYARGVGFPDANHYGHDAVTFGSSYNGPETIAAAETMVLLYAQQNGFPNAVFMGSPPVGVTLN